MGLLFLDKVEIYVKLGIIFYCTCFFWKCHKTFKFVDTKPCRKINYTIIIQVFDNFYVYLITNWKLKMKTHVIFYSDF